MTPRHECVRVQRRTSVLVCMGSFHTKVSYIIFPSSKSMSTLILTFHQHWDALTNAKDVTWCDTYCTHRWSYTGSLCYVLFSFSVSKDKFYFVQSLYYITAKMVEYWLSSGKTWRQLRFRQTRTSDWVRLGRNSKYILLIKWSCQKNGKHLSELLLCFTHAQ